MPARGTREEPVRVLAMLHLPPPIHGLALKNQRMLESEVARALRFRVIRYRFARSLEDLGRFSLPKLALAAWYLVRQVAAIVARRPDVGYLTIATEGGPLVRDAVYMNVFRLFRVPYVLHVPTLGLERSVREGRGPAGRVVRSGVTGAASLVALGGAHAQELASVVPAERVRVVENGLPEVDPPRRGVAGSRVLFLSNLREEKGLFTLLDAAPRVLEAVPSMELVIAGPLQDESTTRRFRAALAALGAGDRVRHVPPVYGDAKLELLSAADLFVFPSHRENSPSSVIEAMRHALPVVATRVGGLPELVEDGVTGVLVPPGDAAALADALVRLLRDPATMVEMGRRGRERFEARFTLERWERELTEVIRSAAGGGRTDGQRERTQR